MFSDEPPLCTFQSSEAAFEVQLLKKIGCFKLMELLYSRLPKEEVYSKESRINQAYCRSDRTEGNELSKALIKCVFTRILDFIVTDES